MSLEAVRDDLRALAVLLADVSVERTLLYRVAVAARRLRDANANAFALAVPSLNEREARDELDEALGALRRYQKRAVRG